MWMVIKDVVASSLVIFFLAGCSFCHSFNYMSPILYFLEMSGFEPSERATVASRRATNLATHLPKSGNFVMEPWFHTTAFVGCALLGCFRSCHIFGKTNCRWNSFHIWSSFMEKQRPLLEIHSQVIFATKLVLKTPFDMYKNSYKGKIWYSYKIQNYIQILG